MNRPGSPLQVLVIQTAFLGDVVLTTPLLRALRRRYPEARLTALVTPETAPLLEENPHLDRLLRYDKRGGESFASVLGRVRRGQFDLLLAPHRSQRTAFLSLLSRVPVRVGFAGSRVPAAYTRTVQRPIRLHEVDRNLALLAGLDSEPEPGDRVLHVGYTDAEKQAVAAVLAAAGVGDDPFAVLCPGSVWATKRWPAGGFTEVGRGLRQRGYPVVVLGGPDDAAVCREVAEGVGAGAVNAQGKTPLKALAAWLARAALLVTNDSAPLHVAAACGTPTVAVFGATTPSLGFGPLHDRARVAQVDLACRPCGSHGGASCPEGHFRCMTEVTPAQVLAHCDALLDATSGCRARRPE